MKTKIYLKDCLYEINIHHKKIGITKHLPQIKSFYYLNFKTKTYHSRHDDFRFTKNIPFHYGVTKVLECLCEINNFSEPKEHIIRLISHSF
jgi:hypothetical protein